MTVSITTTSKKYHGRMAETYEPNRITQGRWKIENEEVERLLAKLKPRSVLDVPVGTGRYIPAYERLNVKRVIGVDVSDEMVAQAAKKAKRVKNCKGITLKVKDVRMLKTEPVDVSVCVRFLDLIDEEAMRQVVKKLMSVSEKAIICTIRFGPKYVPKSNTAEHDESKFRSLLKKNGWKIAKAIPVFTQGWFILLLKPQ